MKIGQKVSYIRQFEDATAQGDGVVKAISLDPTGREIYLIKDDVLSSEDGTPLVFNTFTQCIDADDEFIERFKAMVIDINIMVKAANEEIKTITTQHNERIEAVYSGLLGEGITL